MAASSIRLPAHFGLCALLLLTGCARMTLAWAPSVPKGEEAMPPILSAVADMPPVQTIEDWEARKERVRSILEDEIYGTFPDGARTEVLAHRIIDEQAFGGIGRFEEFDVEVTPSFGGEAGGPALFTMAVISPVDAGPHPVIMTETFCPRWSAIPHPDASRPPGVEDEEMPGFVSYVFGRYICTPPIEDILDAGFALAVTAATDVVPDSEERGIAALEMLAKGHVAEEDRWGAIAAWGWVFSRMADVLSGEERFDADRLITYGHSRYGKAALVAAAFDERIAGVIAHQSGTGGASLNRDKPGESIKAINDGYPHWFSQSYRAFNDDDDALTLDQHHLIGLVAPRPVLLGNARRDVWSDPNGGFRAAQGALPVYALYGDDGIVLDRLDTFRPEETVSFWMRPGTHGVVEEDWPAFLAFLEAHF